MLVAVKLKNNLLPVFQNLLQVISSTTKFNNNNCDARLCFINISTVNFVRVVCAFNSKQPYVNKLVLMVKWSFHRFLNYTGKLLLIETKKNKKNTHVTTKILQLFCYSRNLRLSKHYFRLGLIGI